VSFAGQEGAGREQVTEGVLVDVDDDGDVGRRLRLAGVTARSAVFDEVHERFGEERGAGWDLDVGAVAVLAAVDAEQAVGFGLHALREPDRRRPAEVDGGGDLIAGAFQPGMVARHGWFDTVAVGQP
jgi:hypothetical protein